MRNVRADHRRRWPLGGPLEDYSRLQNVGIAIAFAAIGIVAFAFPLAIAERIVLAGLAAGGLVRLGYVLRTRRKLRPHGMLSLEGKALVRRENGSPPSTLAEMTTPFGITILANPTRTEALLAFTTPSQTRYQRVRVTSPQDAATARDMLGRAITVPDADAMGAQAIDNALTASHAAEVVSLAEEHAPSALGRIYLTGSRGEMVVLDGSELKIQDRLFDLSSPLEWRGFMFHETIGPIATVYQATWIRQAGAEAVLVAPMPAEVTTALSPGATADMKETDQRAVLRDLKLMQSSADAPPPRELRIGVERLFMLPLRQALDRAPRASRADIPEARALNPRAS